MISAPHKWPGQEQVLVIYTAAIITAQLKDMHRANLIAYMHAPTRRKKAAYTKFRDLINLYYLKETKQNGA